MLDHNATQAAIRAGYSAKTARQIAEQNMRKPQIKSEIDKKLSELDKKSEDLRERVIQQLSRRAFRDIRKLYNPDGSFKIPGEWDDETAAAIDNIEVAEITSEGKTLGLLKKVKAANPDKALEMLGKHLGIFRDEGPQSGNVFNVQINIG